MIESVKEIGYVSKCNPTGKLTLKRIKMIFSPVHQSNPVIVDYPTLHVLFGKELDCASVITATHTHAISYKMAFNLHPIICTWDVVTSHC